MRFLKAVCGKRRFQFSKHFRSFLRTGLQAIKANSPASVLTAFAEKATVFTSPVILRLSPFPKKKPEGGGGSRETRKEEDAKINPRKDTPRFPLPPLGKKKYKKAKDRETRKLSLSPPFLLYCSTFSFVLCLFPTSAAKRRIPLGGKRI